MIPLLCRPKIKEKVTFVLFNHLKSWNWMSRSQIYIVSLFKIWISVSGYKKGDIICYFLGFETFTCKISKIGETLNLTTNKQKAGNSHTCCVWRKFENSMLQTNKEAKKKKKKNTSGNLTYQTVLKSNGKKLPINVYSVSGALYGILHWKNNSMLLV